MINFMRGSIEKSLTLTTGDLICLECIVQRLHITIEEYGERSSGIDMVRHLSGDELSHVVPSSRISGALGGCASVDGHPVHTHMGCATHQFRSQLDILIS